jgi:SAM-dependent MidA family methyltransferase
VYQGGGKRKPGGGGIKYWDDLLTGVGAQCREKTPNAQRRTSNIEVRTSTLHFCDWTLGVRRWTFSGLQTELVQFIRDTIRAHGPQSFAWFVEQALYHPKHGYYSSGRAAIGRKGDYFTNVSVGPLFGRLLAAQFAEIWERLGKIDDFFVIEQGAHDGAFARDVLEALRESSPEFFSALRYRIVEPFPVLQDRQSQTLALFRDKVTWRDSIETLEPFAGIHFSNELLDAMPINLRGKLVGLKDDNFIFVEGPTEVRTNQAALDWIDNVSTKLERGFIIAIDYGFVDDEFRESVQVRAQHRHLDSPFEQVGDADITAHINWTEIAERAVENGFCVAGFTDQHHFLTGIISKFPDLFEDERSKRALQTLLHPEMLGRAFQVLALSKDVDLAAAPLAGFKFARAPRL